MTQTDGAIAVAGDARKVMGRPKKEEYVLQVNITRRVRGTYVKGSSRSVVLQNAPWDEDRFAAMVERMARAAAGGKVPSKSTTRVVAL